MLALSEHLESISNISTGTNITEYLCDDEAEVCIEFLRLARNISTPWAGSTPIELKVKRSGQPVWRNPGSYPVHPLNRFISLSTTWQGAGIRIGDLKREGERTAVVLCSDTVQSDPTLRCERVPGFFPVSYGLGYGRLPDRDLLQHAGAESVNGLVMPNFEQLLAKHLI